MTYGIKDPFGFNKAINWDKLEDPKVLKELEKIFDEEKKPQATSRKLQAASFKLDKTGFRDYKGYRKE
jgi:hypothetical protein